MLRDNDVTRRESFTWELNQTGWKGGSPVRVQETIKPTAATKWAS